MKSLAYLFFFVSSCVLGMQQIVVDPALAPTKKERKEIVKNKDRDGVTYNDLLRSENRLHLDEQVVCYEPDAASQIIQALKGNNKKHALALLCASNNLRVNEPTGHGTLLQIAAKTGALKFAKQLLEGPYGAEVDGNAGPINATPLQLALVSGFNQSALLALLLKHGANPLFKVTVSRSWDKRYKKVQTFTEWCLEKETLDCLEQLVRRKFISGNERLPGSNMSLINKAAWSGSLQVVQVALERDDYVAGNELTVAADSNHKQIVDLLVNSPKTVFTQLNTDDVLRASARCGWVGTAHRVIDKMRALHYDFDAKDCCGRTPLMEAVLRGKTEFAAMLLAAGADATTIDTQLLVTALGSSSSNGALPSTMVELLLPYGVDINAARAHMVKEFNMTPLEYVLSGKPKYSFFPHDFQLARTLLEQRVAPNDFIEQSPLQIAVERGDSYLVRELLSHGADPEIVLADGRTLLHVGARAGSIDILEQLFEAGLTVQPDTRGASPLVYGLATNDCELLQFLLKHGDDLFVVIDDQGGRGCIGVLSMAMVAQCKSEILQFLVLHGLSLEQKDQCGCTALHFAVITRNQSALEWLVAHGADLGVVDNEGKTPLSYISSLHRCEQTSLIHGMLKGLSASVGGIMSLGEVIESLEKEDISGYPQLDREQWERQFLCDPFKRIAKNCAEQYMPNQLQPIQAQIRFRAAQLIEQSIKEAIKNDDCVTIIRYLQAGIDMRPICDCYGESVLSWAAEKGHNELITHLLKTGGFSEQGYPTKALVHVADSVCASLLLDHGAVVTEDALSRAACSSKLDVCKLLLEWHNGVLTKTDIQKAYEWASGSGDIACIETLLDAGVIPTPFDVACAVQRGNSALVKLLVTRGIVISYVNQYVQNRESNTWPSLAYKAVEEKDLVLLQTVIETADESLLCKAVQLDWPEGLAELLTHGIRPKQTNETDLIKCAISAKSLACYKLLVDSGLPVKEEHLKFALNALRYSEPCFDNVDIMSFLLQKVCPSQGVMDEFIVLAASSRLPNMSRLLLEHGARLCAVNDNADSGFRVLSYFHVLALFASEFGVPKEHVGSIGVDWQKRVKRVHWLQAWKRKWLGGADINCDVPELSFFLKNLLDTLYVVMTTPVCADAQEHKEQIIKLLLWVDNGGEIPFNYAQKFGNSSTFNDLLDPQKVEQWFGAIDRAYENKKV